MSKRKVVNASKNKFDYFIKCSNELKVWFCISREGLLYCEGNPDIASYSIVDNKISHLTTDNTFLRINKKYYNHLIENNYLIIGSGKQINHFILNNKGNK